MLEHQGSELACQKLIERFCQEEGQQRYLSQRTIASYKNTLAQLARWAKAQGLRIAQLSADEVKQFLMAQRSLHAKANRTQNLNITILRAFYRYLFRAGMCQHDPACHLRFIKNPPTVPPALSALDIDRLLRAPNTDTMQGVADRALLELLYATGIRVGEIITLQLADTFLMPESPDKNSLGNYMIVRATNSKTKADHIIPFHSECAYWLGRYINEVRPKIPGHRKYSHLFIKPTPSGLLNRHSINRQLKRYAAQVRITSRLYPHLLRHTFATHLLQNSAHLLAISQLLGHANLASTQIYTHTNNEHLKGVHKRHHPRGDKEIA